MRKGCLREPGGRNVREPQEGFEIRIKKRLERSFLLSLLCICFPLGR